MRPCAHATACLCAPAHVQPRTPARPCARSRPQAVSAHFPEVPVKVIACVLALVGCFLVYDLFFGHNGIKQYKTVAMQLEKEQEKALYLQKRNQAVADQINDLKQGSIAVEELARSELGLIRPNERFYRVLASEEKIRSMPLR
nr:septum formation initiator family protein [Anaerobiospirillum sp. NML120449]